MELQLLTPYLKSYILFKNYITFVMSALLYGYRADVIEYNDPQEPYNNHKKRTNVPVAVSVHKSIGDRRYDFAGSVKIKLKLIFLSALYLSPLSTYEVNKKIIKPLTYCGLFYFLLSDIV